MASVNEKNYFEFKKLFVTAQTDGKLTFEFEGQQILTAYAKYVVQFVDRKKVEKQKAHLN
ncbi:MAG: hypothetical protein JRJ45_00100 [Deltaproteobacteria bacterium]|nr:hypothetical protein [Deltaproteobacteria bacterium]